MGAGKAMRARVTITDTEMTSQKSSTLWPTDQKVEQEYRILDTRETTDQKPWSTELTQKKIKNVGQRRQELRKKQNSWHWSSSEPHTHTHSQEILSSVLPPVFQKRVSVLGHKNRYVQCQIWSRRQITMGTGWKSHSVWRLDGTTGVGSGSWERCGCGAEQIGSELGRAA